MRTRDVALGIGAGLIANIVVGRVDKIFSRFISEDQKEKERKVREGSPHDVAGKKIATKVLGHVPSQKSEQAFQMGFTLFYGTLWGILYTLARRKVPFASKYGGVPFAVPFFLFCDGFMAPKLGLTPKLKKIPWQPNAKELMNHVTWTGTVETIHRLVAKYEAPKARLAA